MSSLLTTPPFSTTSHARFQSLYADFSSQRFSNPDSFHANVEWWKRALEAIAGRGMQNEKGKEVEGKGSGNKLVLTAGGELAEIVRIQGLGKPLALGTVIVSR
jgi:charged multivesicular body protein 7